MPVEEKEISANTGYGVGDLPVTVGFTTPAPPLPPLPTISDLGAGPFDFGLKVIVICPGYPSCKRTGGPCVSSTGTVKKVDPSDFLPIKLPGLPTIPAFPTFTMSKKVPPPPHQPSKCPNYPEPPPP